MMAVLIIDFVSMALFLRNCLGFGRLPSAVGGFLFAFGSPRPAQLGHQQLLPQFFTIFALHGLFRFFEPRKMSAKQGIHVFFLCFAAQLWAGFYLGWYLFLGLFVAAIWALCLRRYRRPLLHVFLFTRSGQQGIAASVPAAHRCQVGCLADGYPDHQRILGKFPEGMVGSLGQSGTRRAHELPHARCPPEMEHDPRHRSNEGLLDPVALSSAVSDPTINSVTGLSPVR